jgi:hypothetical protein
MSMFCRHWLSLQSPVNAAVAPNQIDGTRSFLSDEDFKRLDGFGIGQKHDLM